MELYYKTQSLIGVMLVMGWLVGCGLENTASHGDDLEDFEGSEKAFANSLFPVVEEHCSECHADIQAPFFALPGDLQESHDAILQQNLVRFKDPAISQLVLRVEGGHNCWSNCEADAEKMLSEIKNWAEELPEQEDSDLFETAAKLVPNASSGDEGERVMEFYIDELDSSIPVGTKLIVELEDFSDSSYRILNLKVKITESLAVKSPNVYVNGLEARPNNAYTLIDTTVEFDGKPDPNAFETLELSTDKVIIDKGIGLGEGVPGGPGVDMIHFSFEEIESVIGDIEE